MAQAAALASAQLMVEHDLRFNLDRWDSPVIAVFAADTVAGFVQYEIKSPPLVEVSLAWCDPRHPFALASLVGRIREIAREKKARGISFTRHQGNATMGRFVEITGAKLQTLSYEISVEPEAE